MSKYKKEIEKIDKKTDFKIPFAGVTKIGEFAYKEHGGSVRPDLNYHIHYTNSKSEIFMLGGIHSSSTKIIEKIGGSKSLFKRYGEISISSKDKYPITTLAKPSKSDYRIGTFTRYFAQSLTNTAADIFEVSEEDYDSKNNLYTYITFEWRISGAKQEIMRDNQKTINVANTELPGIFRKLSPFNFWRPSPGSLDSLQKKLTLLKKY